MLRKKIQGQTLFLSELAHEACTHHGLSLSEMVILCIEPDSEWGDLINWISPGTTSSSGFACIVTDKTAMTPILEVIPEITGEVERQLPAGYAKLIALGHEEVYVCQIEAIPKTQFLN
jgi:hypothetical protein